jgi:hypothetical protein
MSVAHACESEEGLRQSRALRIEGVTAAARAAATTAESGIFLSRRYYCRGDGAGI